MPFVDRFQDVLHSPPKAHGEEETPRESMSFETPHDLNPVLKVKCNPTVFSTGRAMNGSRVEREKQLPNASISNAASSCCFDTKLVCLSFQHEVKQLSFTLCHRAVKAKKHTLVFLASHLPGS